MQLKLEQWLEDYRRGTQEPPPDFTNKYTKMSHAKQIVKEEQSKGSSRDMILNRLVNEVPFTPGAARTYYYRLR